MRSQRPSVPSRVPGVVPVARLLKYSNAQFVLMKIPPNKKLGGEGRVELEAQGFLIMQHRIAWIVASAVVRTISRAVDRMHSLLTREGPAEFLDRALCRDSGWTSPLLQVTT